MEDLGEVDTGDPEILATFLARALLTYPRARKAIGFWDHGTGVFDETDASEKLLTRSMFSVPRAERSRSRPARRLFFPKQRLQSEIRVRSMLHDDTNGGVLTNLEASKMLSAAFRRANQQDPVDLIFSDTCLNGMVEVLDEIGHFAHYCVASSDLEPGDGWDYRRWFSLMSSNPPATAGAWAQQAVTAFGDCYRENASQHPCTLAAAKGEHRVSDAFANVLQLARLDGQQGFFALDTARSRSQGFDNRDTYDILDFAKNASQLAQSSALQESMVALSAAVGDAMLCSVNFGQTVTNANGLAFWFPGSRHALERDGKTYRRLAFNRKTNWVDYLEEFR